MDVQRMARKSATSLLFLFQQAALEVLFQPPGNLVTPFSVAVLFLFVCFWGVLLRKRGLLIGEVTTMLLFHRVRDFPHPKHQ